MDGAQTEQVADATPAMSEPQRAQSIEKKSNN